MNFQVLAGSTCDPWQGELQAVADAQVGCSLSSLDLEDFFEHVRETGEYPMVLYGFVWK